MPINTFPNLSHKGFIVTSSESTQYNCFSWAVGDNTRRWEPDLLGSQYWPVGIVRECTIGAFLDLFKSLGYDECLTDELEIGVEKIAIYTRNGIPRHAAKQLENGQWTSKLGDYEDISHDITGLQGRMYGMPTHFLKRHRR